MNAVTQQEYHPHPARITVRTSRFGEIDVDPDRIITMINPFLGFPESRRFILRPHSPSSPLMWLQSLDNPELAFVVIQPELLGVEYQPKIPRQVYSDLQLAGEERREILVILTIPAAKPREMTANLLGPVILNSEKRLAVQVVLDSQHYDACYRLFPNEG